MESEHLIKLNSDESNSDRQVDWNLKFFIFYFLVEKLKNWMFDSWSIPGGTKKLRKRVCFSLVK